MMCSPLVKSDAAHIVAHGGKALRRGVPFGAGLDQERVLGAAEIDERRRLRRGRAASRSER